MSVNLPLHIGISRKRHSFVVALLLSLFTTLSCDNIDPLQGSETLIYRYSNEERASEPDRHRQTSKAQSTSYNRFSLALMHDYGASGEGRIEEVSGEVIGCLSGLKAGFRAEQGTTDVRLAASDRGCKVAITALRHDGLMYELSSDLSEVSLEEGSIVALHGVGHTGIVQIKVEKQLPAIIPRDELEVRFRIMRLERGSSVAVSGPSVGQRPLACRLGLQSLGVAGSVDTVFQLEITTPETLFEIHSIELNPCAGNKGQQGRCDTKTINAPASALTHQISIRYPGSGPWFPEASLATSLGQVSCGLDNLVIPDSLDENQCSISVIEEGAAGVADTLFGVTLQVPNYDVVDQVSLTPCNGCETVTLGGPFTVFNEYRYLYEHKHGNHQVHVQFRMRDGSIISCQRRFHLSN